MIIGITINNILRDHLSKLEMVYNAVTGQEALLPINPYNLADHFISTGTTEEPPEFIEDLTVDETSETHELTPIDDGDKNFDVYQLLYVDASFEIFGSCEETIPGLIRDLSLLSKDLSENSNHSLILTNLESSRSKCATLFFLSKNFFDMREIFFPETREIMWEKFDVLITDDPKILAIKPDGKKSIKIENNFNTTVDSDLTVSTIKELVDNFQEIIKKL